MPKKCQSWRGGKSVGLVYDLLNAFCRVILVGMEGERRTVEWIGMAGMEKRSRISMGLRRIS